MRYERRHELNIETWVSPERTAALEEKQIQRESDKVVHDAYGLMRAGAHIQSFKMLEAWLCSRGNAPEDYRWLCERTASWDDPRYVTRLTEEQVARLLTLKRSGEALDVVTRRLERDPNFRPKSAADTLSIAQLAARGGGASRLARILLSDFADRFAATCTLQRSRITWGPWRPNEYLASLMSRPCAVDRGSRVQLGMTYCVGLLVDTVL